MRGIWNAEIPQNWIPDEWVAPALETLAAESVELSRGMRTLEQCLTDVQHVILDEQRRDIVIFSLTEEEETRNVR